MNFLELLMLSRKMEFKENGEITLYGQDIVILPDALMMEYILQIENDQEQKKAIYATAKSAMIEHKSDIAKTYKISEGINWICNTINLFGQGRINYENPSGDIIGTILVENAPTARELKGLTKTQTEHVLRGIVAGMVSTISQKNIDAIEVECVANGSSKCKFILDTSENLKNKFPALHADQI